MIQDFDGICVQCPDIIGHCQGLLERQKTDIEETVQFVLSPIRNHCFPAFSLPSMARDEFFHVLKGLVAIVHEVTNTAQPLGHDRDVLQWARIIQCDEDHLPDESAFQPVGISVFSNATEQDDKKNISQGQVEIMYELSDGWNHMFGRMATYAYAMLATMPHRFSF